jgi:hypothetical protein
LTPLAFADDDSSHPQVGGYNGQDSTAQVPIQACHNSVDEGVVGYLATHQENKDSHDGKCGQKNSATDGDD